VVRPAINGADLQKFAPMRKPCSFGQAKQTAPRMAAVPARLDGKPSPPRTYWGIVGAGRELVQRGIQPATRAARTIARMPALIGSGSVGQASSTAANWGSNGPFGATSAPHSAPLWSAIVEFPDDSEGSSNPVPATCSKTCRSLKLGYLSAFDSEARNHGRNLYRTGFPFLEVLLCRALFLCAHQSIAITKQEDWLSSLSLVATSTSAGAIATRFEKHKQVRKPFRSRPAEVRPPAGIPNPTRLRF